MALERAKPSEIRKSIEMANHLAKNGIYFIPVPVCGDSLELIEMLKKNLEELERLAEVSHEPRKGT